MWFRAGATALVVAAVAVSAWLAATAPMGVDYVSDFRLVDTARPQIDALVDLDLQRFVHEQSPLGPVSLVARAPFAAVADAGDQAARYRLGSFPCVLALALAGLALAFVLRRRGSPLWHGALAVAILLFGAPTHQALAWGHPEALLLAGLIVASGLAAGTGRRIPALLLLGIAIGVKPTGALALAPIVAMLGFAPIRHAAVAAAIGAVLVAPLALADVHAFRDAAARANDIAAPKPMSVWWRTSTRRVSVTIGGNEVRSVRKPRIGDPVRGAIRPIIFVLSVLLTLWAARAGPLTLQRGFALLAVVLLARCVLDPGDQTYYHAPFLACLAAAETLRGRPPLLALVAAVMMSSAALRAVGSDLDAINIEYLAWSIPLLLLLAIHVGTARHPAAGGSARLSPGHAGG